ncbi:ABC transporter permease [Prauserella marina]|uniref:FtsX-like permease family protein n=1 Tax=Prauserella marina TaxID=530584 RepID=A0A222VTI9_9PSEU|nr:FtsX-like permease family protein [Prauserella marina]ASR37247.1 ABC transporter permease [Prauserella marina]PWV72576.1 FtsX-like permease family protein [Prauserella marina]SDD76780.1 FtsX-like permease family protein [Prauserella marina]
MIRDLLLGLRLAVGGGRISGQALLRLLMTTLGVALVVAVLLPAASINTMVGKQSERSEAQTATAEPQPGADPLYRLHWFIDSGDDYLQATVLAPGGPNAPVPPGLDRLPAQGEVVVSPAAADFLDSEAGASTRARIGGTIVGEVGKPGLVKAGDRVVFVGASADQIKDESYTETVYGFGIPPSESSGGGIDIVTMALVAPIAAVLLVPLLIFVTTASRMGAAQRERRLAALRLLGVSGRQVRRVAAAESLVGALAGLLLGGALFLALRPLVGKLDLFGLRFFPEDFVPSWQLVVFIALLVPGLAVGAAIFGLRRTIVEPLGVVRHGKASQRRMWWRWAIAIAGALMMGATLLAEERSNATTVGLALSAGSTLLLVGVAALLPWAVEKIVARISGGSPSWQLAVRRLQLESGTASRVVSGLVVVLAGAILIQTMVGAISTTDPEGSTWQPEQPVAAQLQGDRLPEAEELLAEEPRVSAVHQITATTLNKAEGGHARGWTVLIGDCAALATRAELGSCSDGDVFAVGAGSREPEPTAAEEGESARFISYLEGEPLLGPEWTIPAGVTRIPADEAVREVSSTLLITPGALGGIQPPDTQDMLFVTGTGDSKAIFEAAAVAVSPLGWSLDVWPPLGMYESDRLDETTATMRGLMLTASLFVLAVAALSLLMLSIEQITERRRPLAALSAAGVPLSVLARGSLWQIAIPVGVGVVLAVVAGIGITLPTLRYAGLDLSLDIGLIGVVCGAAIMAVLVTTVLTLPLLRQVTKLDSLRAE